MLGAAAQIAGGGHAEGGAQSGAGVAGPEAVVGTLGAVEETAGAARLAETAEECTLAAGEQFVHVTLVGDVEDKLVVGRVKDPVQRDAELDDAQVGPDVAAVFGGDGDDFIPNLLRELRELAGRKGFDVGGAVNGFEKSGGRNVHQV